MPAYRLIRSAKKLPAKSQRRHQPLKQPEGDRHRQPPGAGEAGVGQRVGDGDRHRIHRQADPDQENIPQTDHTIFSFAVRCRTVFFYSRAAARAAACPDALRHCAKKGHQKRPMYSPRGLYISLVFNTSQANARMLTWEHGAPCKLLPYDRFYFLRNRPICQACFSAQNPFLHRGRQGGSGVLMMPFSPAAGRCAGGVGAAGCRPFAARRLRGRRGARAEDAGAGWGRVRIGWPSGCGDGAARQRPAPRWPGGGGGMPRRPRRGGRGRCRRALRRAVFFRPPRGASSGPKRRRGPAAPFAAAACAAAALARRAAFSAHSAAPAGAAAAFWGADFFAVLRLLGLLRRAGCPCAAPASSCIG